MRDYGQIATRLRGSCWLITEDALSTILEIVDRRMSGQQFSEEEIELRLSQANAKKRRGQVEAGGGVGILPLYGPIFPKANLMTEMSGATSIEQFRSDFNALLSNDLVSTIVLDVDSPGGMADMIPEMAQEIFDARGTKPILAVANTMIASAAYFLASQADRVYSTPSGSVGSIGTYYVHTDASEAFAKAGVKNTVIKAGRFKAELLPFEPLSQESKDYLQGYINEVNQGFLDAVARGRNTDVETVSSQFGEGRMLTAKNALEVGMIDGVQTLDSVLGSLLSGQDPLSTPPVGPSKQKGRIGVLMSYDREMEHSEPGTGSPPEPRTTPDDEDVDEWKDGERLEKPPGILESEERVMNRDQLLAFAERLGIANAADLSDEDLNTQVTTKLDSVVDEVTEMRQAASRGTEQLEFAKQFPEQAALMERLQQQARASEAKAFAAEFDRLGDTNKGLSALAKQTIEDVHLKMAERTLVVDDLRTLVGDVANGVVEYGEVGSSRQGEEEPVADPNASPAENRRKFFQKVEELMANDGLDRKAAISEASKRYPKLAEAYVRS